MFFVLMDFPLISGNVGMSRERFKTCGLEEALS